MEDVAQNELPWIELFDWNKNPWYGYVYDIETALDIVQECAYHTHTTFVSTQSTKDFGYTHTIAGNCETV